MKNADRTAMPNRSQSPDNVFGGLTKREMFAMHAMACLLGGVVSNENKGSITTPSEISSISVKYADVLLEELSK